jgi:hypothetical protein
VVVDYVSAPVHGHECHEGLFSRNLFLGQRIPLGGGHDPRTSALDVHCRPTRWTISTWWTAASFPRAPR